MTPHMMRSGICSGLYALGMNAGAPGGSRTALSELISSGNAVHVASMLWSILARSCRVAQGHRESADDRQRLTELSIMTDEPAWTELPALPDARKFQLLIIKSLLRVDSVFFLPLVVCIFVAITHTVPCALRETAQDLQIWCTTSRVVGSGDILSVRISSANGTLKFSLMHRGRGNINGGGIPITA